MGLGLKGKVWWMEESYQWGVTTRAAKAVWGMPSDAIQLATLATSKWELVKPIQFDESKKISFKLSGLNSGIHEFLNFQDSYLRFSFSWASLSSSSSATWSEKKLSGRFRTWIGLCSSINWINWISWTLLLINWIHAHRHCSFASEDMVAHCEPVCNIWQCSEMNLCWPCANCFESRPLVRLVKDFSPLCWRWRCSGTWRARRQHRSQPSPGLTIPTEMIISSYQLSSWCWIEMEKIILTSWGTLCSELLLWTPWNNNQIMLHLF